MMKEYKISIPVKIYDFADELDKPDRELLNSAVEACKQSYAPFSNFNVGAAVLLADGTIIKGSNQENSAYPSGLCAERVAVFHANSQYPNVPVIAIAVTSAVNGKLNDFPVRPCGACRQSLLQSEIRFKNNIKVIMGSSKSVETLDSIKLLLPLSFDLDDYK